MNNFLKHGQKSSQTTSVETATHDGDDDDSAEPAAMDISACGESSALAQYNAITAKQPKIVIDLDSLVDVTDKRDDGVSDDVIAGAGVRTHGQSDIVAGASSGHQTSAGTVNKCGVVHGPDPTKPLRLKAKVLRQQRKLEKQLAKSNGDAAVTGDSATIDHQAPVTQANTSAVGKQNQTAKVEKGAENTLRSLFAAMPVDGQHKLEVDNVHFIHLSVEIKVIFHLIFRRQVKLVPSSPALADAELDLYRRYQMRIHKDPPEKVTRKNFETFLVRSPLKVIIVPHLT